MKTLRLIFIFLILTFQFCYAQDKKVPKNLKQAVEYLQSDCNDSLKTLIKKTNNEKLFKISYPGDGQYKTIYSWLSDRNEGIAISKYLINRGISYHPHQEEIILLCFKDFLLNKAIDERVVLRPYQIIEAKWAKEDSVRFKTDSLRGFYIPRDLDDCFNRLNKMLANSAKAEVRDESEEEFTAGAHFGLGLWMRNNWQLRGGSRLSTYFDSLGVRDAESMSGIILLSYHRYVHGKNIKLQDQISEDKQFWAQSKRKDSLRQEEDFKKFNIGDTVEYKYPFEFVSDKQENNFYHTNCQAKGIIQEIDSLKLYLKVKILTTCGPEEIIVYDSKNSYVFDKQTKKWVRPKKHTLIKARENDIRWYRYDYWYPKD